jgi:hypothetical protein
MHSSMVLSCGRVVVWFVVTCALRGAKSAGFPHRKCNMLVYIAEGPNLIPCKNIPMKSGKIFTLDSIITAQREGNREFIHLRVFLYYNVCIASHPLSYTPHKYPFFSICTMLHPPPPPHIISSYHRHSHQVRFCTLLKRTP